MSLLVFAYFWDERDGPESHRHPFLFFSLLCMNLERTRGPAEYLIVALLILLSQTKHVFVLVCCLSDTSLSETKHVFVLDCCLSNTSFKDKSMSLYSIVAFLILLSQKQSKKTAKRARAREESHLLPGLQGQGQRKIVRVDVDVKRGRTRRGGKLLRIGERTACFVQT